MYPPSISSSWIPKMVQSFQSFREREKIEVERDWSKETQNILLCKWYKNAQPCDCTLLDE